jgi:predicted HicB family RNase H-like nuclease
MFPLSPKPRSTRPYAKRLPPELVRRAMLSVRVHENARRSVKILAQERRMSVSEYVCRLLNDHLAASRRRCHLK